MKKLIVAATLLSPALVFAQSQDLGDVLDTIDGLLRMVIPIILVVALIVFFWGLIKYLGSAGDSEARSSAISLMIMGVVVLFVMVSVWGLVEILQSTVGIQGGTGEVTNPVDSIPDTTGF